MRAAEARGPAVAGALAVAGARAVAIVMLAVAVVVRAVVVRVVLALIGAIAIRRAAGRVRQVVPAVIGQAVPEVVVLALAQVVRAVLVPEVRDPSGVIVMMSAGALGAAVRVRQAVPAVIGQALPAAAVLALVVRVVASRVRNGVIVTMTAGVLAAAPAAHVPAVRVRVASEAHVPSGVIGIPIAVARDLLAGPVLSGPVVVIATMNAAVRVAGARPAGRVRHAPRGESGTQIAVRRVQSDAPVVHVALAQAETAPHARAERASPMAVGRAAIGQRLDLVRDARRRRLRRDLARTVRRVNPNGSDGLMSLSARNVFRRCG